MADRTFDPATGLYMREMAGRVGRQAPQNNAINRKFLVYKTADPLKGLDALSNQRVALGLDDFAGLGIDSVEWTIHSGPDHWAFVINYTDIPPIGGYTISMDTSGGTTTVTEAYAQTGWAAPGQPLPNWGTAVNVQNGRAVGTDKVTQALRYNVRARIASRWLTDPIAYAKLVAGVTGWYNGTPFLGHPVGELLFRGASGEIVGEDPMLSYTFEAGPNWNGGQVGPITGITHLAHDFQWLTYYEEQDGVSQQVIAKPRALYAARIYQPADFGILRIGEP